MANQPTVRTGAAASLTPSQQVIADANALIYVTDARGRRIGVRKMTMSVRRRVLKAVPVELAAKDRYLGLVMTAACVVTIDDENVDPMVDGRLRDDQRVTLFDVLIDRLDDDGFEVVMPIISPRIDDKDLNEEVKK